jgi:exodeoxyribonuclease-5
LKRNIIDTGVLNGDQRAAFGKLIKYVRDPSDRSIFVLRGWAGTGKTFCVSLMVNYLLSELYPDKNWYRIAVTGPTNKSVRVIRRSSDIIDPRVSFQTIHKLLGLKEKITTDGKQEFVKDPGFMPKISKIKLLIIDEVSMLNDDLFEKIIKHRDNIKIICMGDPAQIPPVGRPDCIPFTEDLAEEYGIATIDLKTIMRQKEDNPIISSSVKIRENINSHDSGIGHESVVNKMGEGIEFLNLGDPNVRKSITPLIGKYFKSELFEEDSEYAKIIAWRNKTVSTMNALVRRTIYGEDQISSKILPGEKLIINSPYIVMGTVVFNTNDEFTVESFEIKTKKYKVEDLEVEIKIYETEVWFLDDNNTRHTQSLEILHEDGEYDFKRFANVLRNIAIQKKGKNKTWIAYYDFLREFADVSYAYCITAHKSQGSTYEVSFVMEDDIDMNWDVIERNRIKYTAYTRASKKLYVLKKF